MARPEILKLAAMSLAISVSRMVSERECRDLLDRSVPSPTGEDVPEGVEVLLAMEGAAGGQGQRGGVSGAERRPPRFEQRPHASVELLVGRAERIVLIEAQGLLGDEGPRIDAPVDSVERDAFGRAFGVAPEIRIGPAVPRKVADVGVHRAKAREREDRLGQDPPKTVAQGDIGHELTEKIPVHLEGPQSNILTRGHEKCSHRLAGRRLVAEQEHLHMADSVSDPPLIMGWAGQPRAAVRSWARTGDPTLGSFKGSIHRYCLAPRSGGERSPARPAARDRTGSRPSRGPRA